MYRSSGRSNRIDKRATRQLTRARFIGTRLAKTGSWSAALATAAVGASLTAAPALGVNGKPCGTVKGAPYTHTAISGQHGNTYLVYVVGYPCAQARSWVPRMTRETLGRPLIDGRALVGPAGFYCIGSNSEGAIANGLKPPQVAGDCWGNGFERGPYFYWRLPIP
jgi:hypothetical protein